MLHISITIPGGMLFNLTEFKIVTYTEEERGWGKKHSPYENPLSHREKGYSPPLHRISMERGPAVTHGLF
jgi:hypothetical protein